ncbi:dienelactone hydrolase family protein [Planotetraspora thailandica]|nr:alpha/beta family hydrolase [Planotetraspora thailandica]
MNDGLFSAHRADLEMSVAFPAAGVVLEADVVIPRGARAVVLFAHGSGSSRHSSRNRFVASELQRAGLATVLADLLTPEEDRTDAATGRLRFDIGLLSGRVTALVDRLAGDEPTRGLEIGLFGASTGAAAALVAAAMRPDLVRTVVSRGGRPDLAGEHLRGVCQPVLLIVGERDPIVIELNREAMDKMVGETRLEIVPGASHLFAESGALEAVAQTARDWFTRHLPAADADSAT